MKRKQMRMKKRTIGTPRKREDEMIYSYLCKGISDGGVKGRIH